MTRVIVTGMGCVTPIGCSVPELQASLFAGRIGVGRLTLFDAERFPVQIAAEVRNWDFDQVGAVVQCWRKSPRQTQFAIGAGLQAALQAGVPDRRIDPAGNRLLSALKELFGSSMLHLVENKASVLTPKRLAVQL